MKQNKSVQIIFLSLILSCFFLSGEVFAYKQSDLNKFENTRKCIKCDLTDLNLSRVNLSRVNLSGSNLSGSDLSESDLSGSNLSGSNLSGVNLNGSNLKDVNLTYANLSGIIIDEKSFSTLDISEFTFMNKSTLAEETKKKEQALRKKKKEQSLRKKKEQSLRKKKEQALRKKKKEQALLKKKEQSLRKKKEQSLRKKNVDGWNDYKFGMSEHEVKTLIPNSCKIEVSYEISTYNCLRIENITIPIVKFRFTSEDKLEELLLTFEGKNDKTKNLKSRLLTEYSKKYKLYKKAHIQGEEQIFFENGQIYIWQYSNSFSVVYCSEEEAKVMRDYIKRKTEGLKPIDKDF